MFLALVTLTLFVVSAAVLINMNFLRRSNFYVSFMSSIYMFQNHRLSNENVARDQVEDITRLAPVYLHPQGVCVVKIMAMTYNIYGDTYNMQHIASYMKAKPKSRNLYFSFASLKVCYTCNRAP